MLDKLDGLFLFLPQLDVSIEGRCYQKVCPERSIR